MKKTIVFTTAVGALFAASSAGAQELGEQGTVVIGAERVVGFTSSKSSFEIDDNGVQGDVESTHTNFALLASDPEAPFAMPRIGADYFVIKSLSVGGFLGYASDASETDYDQ